MTPIDWLPEQIEAALAEGWDIFDTGDEYQLQRHDEAEIFDSDSAAWHHVYDKAQAGSPLHKHALEFLNEHSLDEYWRIMEECAS